MKRKRLSLFITFIGVSTFFLISCSKENALDCFTSTGKEVLQWRKLAEFQEFEVFDNIEVVVKKSNEYQVEVFAGSNLLENIVTEVRDGKLYIENRNTCNFVRGYKHQITVYVYAPYYKFVKNNSVFAVIFDQDFSQDTLVVRTENSGDIYVKGKYDQIRTSSHGNGDMYLDGSCNSFYVYTYGINFVHAENLAIKDYAFIQTLSIGDCYLKGDELKTFEYKIEESGNIYCYGNPKTINGLITDNATGKLISE
jgi:hypothetical protein